MNIKRYNSFISDRYFIDDITKSYLMDNITESEYYDRIDSIIINEGENWNKIKKIGGDVADTLRDFKQTIEIKILESILSFVKGITGGVGKFISKILKLINYVLIKIESFREKNPATFKAIFIISLILLLVCISNQSHAAINQNPNNFIPHKIPTDQLEHYKQVLSYYEKHKHEVNTSMSISNLADRNALGTEVPLSGITRGHNTTVGALIEEWLKDVCKDGQFNGDKVLNKDYLKDINILGQKLVDKLSTDYSKEIRNDSIMNSGKEIVKNIGSDLKGLFNR